MSTTSAQWKLCSSCKKPIAFNHAYYECSVSTCTGDRTGYVFCTVACWERHLPGARHRDAGAVEKRSPNSASSSSATQAPRRIIVNPPATISNSTSKQSTSMDSEVLVVVSKMKTYINEKSDMNTAGDVADLLSDKIRRLCDEAMDQARAEGRKTVMARDFK